jgi:cobalt-zinc-cadmium efflux system membrane fusion protein
MKKNISIMFLFFLAVSCNSPKADPLPAHSKVVNGNTLHLTDQQVKNAGLQIGKAETKTISTQLRVSGKVDVPPQNMVSVSFPLGGYLKSTSLLPGLYVQRGSVLGVLEDIQFIQLQQDYLTARNRLEYLRADYTRQQQLNASKAASDKMFQLATSDYKGQQILVNGLAQKLRLIGINPAVLSEENISKSVNIYSPISGYVTKVNVNIGKYVSSTDVLFELVNPSDIHLVLTVFQKDLPSLKIGQKIEAFTNYDTAKKIPATILLISPDVSRDGTSEVHCHFNQPTHLLLPGMFMNATILSAQVTTVALPESAIVTYENKAYAFEEVSHNVFKMLPVETGETQQGYVAISSANSNKILNGNIVVQNAYPLLMALKNKPEDE